MAEENKKKDDVTRILDKVFDDPFLKQFCASSRPKVDAMTKEEKDRFLTKIIEIGKRK